jgi:hypothetical protein
VTVRQRIDQLAAEPPVRDLGYAADQRLVAGALLGLQLLADEIDALRSECQNTRPVEAGPFDPVDGRGLEDDNDVDDEDEDEDEDGPVIADIVNQLAELTAQVKKLTKAIERSSGKQKKQKQKKPNKPKAQLGLE